MAFQKYYCDYNIEESRLEARLQEYFVLKKNNPKLKFVLLLDKNTFNSEEELKKVISIVRNCSCAGVSPNDFVVSIASLEHRYKTDEWAKVIELETTLKSKNIAFGFEDNNRTWSTKEVENANKSVIYMADDIRKRKLSPFESVLDAYMSVSRKKYKAEEEGEHFSQSRSVYGTLNSDKRVCVGYAQLLKSLIDEIGMDDVNVYINLVATSEDNKTRRGLHANVIIYLKDDKYGIDGYYYLDPTWDSDEEDHRLGFFMVPLREMKTFKKPFIRNINSLSVEKDENTSNSKKEKERDKIYNLEIDAGVSFTQDDFVYNAEFLFDFFKKNPKIASKYKNLITDEELITAEKRFYKYENQRQMLEKIKSELYQIGGGVPKGSEISVYVTINNILQLGNFKQLERIKAQLSKEVGVGVETVPISDIISRMENNLVKNQENLLDFIEKKESGDVYTAILADEAIKISKVNREIDYILTESSSPVQLETILTAIKRVLKSRDPKRPDISIDKEVHDIILDMAYVRQEAFGDFETTSFSDYLEETNLGES